MNVGWFRNLWKPKSRRVSWANMLPWKSVQHQLADILSGPATHDELVLVRNLGGMEERKRKEEERGRERGG